MWEPVATATSNDDDESAMIPVGEGEGYYIVVDGDSAYNKHYNLEINGPARPVVTSHSADPPWVIPPADLTLTVSNTGTATLEVTDITASKAEFTVSATSFSVAPAASQDITVTYTPTSSAARNAKL